MKLAAASLLATSLLLAAPAAAQSGFAAPLSPAVAERLRAVPAQVAGLTRFDSRQGSAMFAYRGEAATAPVITVVMSDAITPVGLRTLAQMGRFEAIRAGLIETMFEGRFSIPGQPEANTFFGDYLTKQGIRQSWIAEYGGVRITILATIYRAEDRRTVFDAIRADLLGGAEMTRKVTPAETN